MNSSNLYFDALKKKYEADIAKAKAILNTYFHDTVGIGEHSELIDEFDKHMEDLASAEDKLEKLNKHFATSASAQGATANPKDFETVKK